MEDFTIVVVGDNTFFSWSQSSKMVIKKKLKVSFTISVKSRC